MAKCEHGSKLEDLCHAAEALADGTHPEIARIRAETIRDLKERLSSIEGARFYTDEGYPIEMHSNRQITEWLESFAVDAEVRQGAGVPWRDIFGQIEETL